MSDDLDAMTSEALGVFLVALAGTDRRAMRTAERAVLSRAFTADVPDMRLVAAIEAAGMVWCCRDDAQGRGDDRWNAATTALETILEEHLERLLGRAADGKAVA